MKKFFSLLLCLILVLSALPLTVLPAYAADGTMYLDVERSVTCKKAGEWKVYTFTPAEDGIYIFSSSGSLDTMGYIALAEGEAQFDDVQDEGGQGDNFAVTYNMTRGVTYYLGSTVVSGSTGTYKIKIIKFEVDDTTIHEITLNQTTSVTTNASKNIRFFSINPGTSGKYFYQSYGNYDTQGYIFDEDWRQIAYSDGGGTAQNYKIELDLQAGKTYYVGYATTSETNATFNVMLWMTTYIRSVTLSSAPNQTTYIKDLDAEFVSEGTYHVVLNLIGFSFKVNYANGTSETRKYAHGIRGLDCETSRNLSAGENDVRFSYMLNSSSFKISVEDTPVLSLEMLQPPAKTVYYEEDAETTFGNNAEKVFNINLYGMVIRARYKDGTTEDFTLASEAGYTVDYGEGIDYLEFDHMIPVENMTIGDNVFTLTYYGVPLSFTIKYSLNSDNWEYSVANGEVILTKYIGEDVNAIIPDTLGGYPVTQIGDECFKDNSALKTLRMSENITAIGAKAFYGCESLRELTLPASLQSIGAQACLGLRGLEKLNWNVPNLNIVRANNVFAYIGENVANGTEVDFGFTCQAVPENAFYPSSTSYSSNIGKIVVGENVTSIGANAFRDLAGGLREVEWNAIEITGTIGTANNIWLNATADDASFEVTLGENVTALPSYLFYAANATRCPRISKLTALSKNTVLNANSLKKNSNVDLTYYCHYNGNNEINSVYKVCVDNDYPYVLLDAPVDCLFIESPMIKDEYIVGENLDLTGLSVCARYEDNTVENVTDCLVVSGFDNTSIGAQTLTFAYTFIDKTVSVTQSILVTAEPLTLSSITITHAANTTVFYAGGVFESDGLAVEAVFTNGMTQDVTDSVILSGYNLNTIGNQTVDISYTYNGVTRNTSYAITVNAEALESIGVQTLPDKMEYVAGEELNLDGLKVIATYNSGATADVTNYCSISDVDMTAKGTQSVGVSYAENGVSKTTSFDILIRNTLQSIYIETMPTKTSFVVGTAFSHIGIKVKAAYENGDHAEVTPFVTYAGYDMGTAGAQTVVITYEEDGVSKTAQYAITVSAVEVESLQLSSAPTALQYIDEPLHTAGLKVVARYNNGNSEDVTDALSFIGFDNTLEGEQTVTAQYTYAEKTVSVSFNVYVHSKSASGLELVSKPTKTTYLLGEDFDSAGILANVLFDNGTKKEIAVSELTFDGFDKTQAGTKLITVSCTYQGTSVSSNFYVTITNYEIAITVTPPAKTSYYYGELLNKAGMSVTVFMADGSSKTIYSGYEVDGYDALALGVQQLTVSYSNTVTGQTLTDTFGVTVSDYETVITVTPPTKTAYDFGEELDTSGMSILASTASGAAKSIPLSAVTLSGYHKNEAGAQTVSVSYKNAKNETLTDTFTVSVAVFETALSVSAPDKTAYFYGEPLNTAGMRATVLWADGSTTTVDVSQLSLSGYSATALGTQTVTVAYTTLTGGTIEDNFSVTLGNYETALAVTAPFQTVYYYGDTLLTAGMSATATMADGSTTAVDISRLSLSGYAAATLGAQEVRVSMQTAKGETLSDTFAVNVLNFEQSITITAQGKTEYSYGDLFDASGVQVRLNMADGTSVTAQSGTWSVSGYDPYLVGEQTITVEYTNVKGVVLTDTYTVTLANVGTSIKVTAPTKTTYYYGEPLNTAGMSASLENVDGSSTPINASQLSLSAFDASTLGEQTIVVSYTTDQGQILKDRFTVTVLNYESALLVEKAGKTEYFYSDAFETDAVQVSAVMADGSKKELQNSDMTFSGYNANKAGTQTVTVNYTNVKGQLIGTTYRVTVMNYENALVLTAPSKKQYYYGEDLDTTGMKVLAVMADKSIKTLDNNLVTLSNYDSTVLGEQQVSVTLVNAKGDTLSKNFKVTVNNFESAITVKAPVKTTYLYAEELNTGGMKVTALMADGSEKVLANASCTVSGYTATTLGAQDITVEYTNVKGEVLSNTFAVNVVNYETAISATAPTKTEYLYAEELALSGVVVTAAMADGTQRTVLASEWTVEGYDARTLGAQTVSVKMTSASGEVLSDSFSVSVQNYLSALELSGTYKTFFLQNEAFESEGLTVFAVYADGTKADVSGSASVAGYDTAVLGAQSVNVSYTDAGKSAQASYGITVETVPQRADVTDDTFIDIADITLILSTANFGKTAAEAHSSAADANRDGVVDIFDISYVLQENVYGKTI